MALLTEAVLDAADDPREVRRFGTKCSMRPALPELATVEVDTVITEALLRCWPAAESANIRITAGPPSGLLHGDATLLITASSNLLDNAIS